MAGEPCYATVRLNCFWYFAGVNPVRPLKTRVKWLWDENPRSRATLARDESVLSVSSDRKIRLRFTKRPILKPVECRNFLAKWLGDIPTRADMSLNDGAMRRCSSA